MKSFITLSMFLATSLAQYTFPSYYSAAPAYAPGYGYSTFGSATASSAAATVAAQPGRTALDIFNPNLVYQNPYSFYNYQNNYLNPYNSFYSSYNPYFGYQPTAAAAIAQPAAALSPANLAVNAPEVAVKSVADEVTVVEADAAPLKFDGPVEIRRIFPIFGSDLRDATEDIVFARPDQINPVKPLIVKEDASELPAVTVIAPDFSLRSIFRPLNAVAPAGIVQATQPRFITPQNVEAPVLAL